MQDAHPVSLRVGPARRPVSVVTDEYTHGGGLAVHLVCEDGEPYATVSVNVEGVRLAADEFVFKTYSENEGLIQAMLAAGAVAITGRICSVGPICRLVTGGGRKEGPDTDTADG